MIRSTRGDVVEPAVEVGPAAEDERELRDLDRQVLGGDPPVVDLEVGRDRADPALAGASRPGRRAEARNFEPSRSTGSSRTEPWPRSDRRTSARVAPWPFEARSRSNLPPTPVGRPGDHRDEDSASDRHPALDLHAAGPDLGLEPGRDRVAVELRGHLERPAVELAPHPLERRRAGRRRSPRLDPGQVEPGAARVVDDPDARPLDLQPRSAGRRRRPSRRVAVRRGGAVPEEVADLGRPVLLPPEPEPRRRRPRSRPGRSGRRGPGRGGRRPGPRPPGARGRRGVDRSARLRSRIRRSPMTPSRSAPIRTDRPVAVASRSTSRALAHSVGTTARTIAHARAGTSSRPSQGHRLRRRHGRFIGVLPRFLSRARTARLRPDRDGPAFEIAGRAASGADRARRTIPHRIDLHNRNLGRFSGCVGPRPGLASTLSGPPDTRPSRPRSTDSPRPPDEPTSAPPRPRPGPPGRPGLAPGLADDLPRVDGVEAQPLAAQVRRVAEALDLLGQPLPPGPRARLDEALATARAGRRWSGRSRRRSTRSAWSASRSTPRAGSRSARARPPAALVQHGWRVFLVKVHNEAGVTAELKATSPNAAPAVPAARPTPRAQAGDPARPRSPTAGWTWRCSATAR